MHKPEVAKAKKKYRLKLREEVLTAYGHTCECCGVVESAFLTIDHINGNGSTHRKEVNPEGMTRWLKINGFPKDNFRLLCFNCNMASYRGTCPHQL